MPLCRVVEWGNERREWSKWDGETGRTDRVGEHTKLLSLEE